MAEIETKKPRGTVREIETDWKTYDNFAAGDFLGQSARGDKTETIDSWGRAWGNAHLGVGFCPHSSCSAGADLAPLPCL